MEQKKIEINVHLSQALSSSKWRQTVCIEKKSLENERDTRFRG